MANRLEVGQQYMADLLALAPEEKRAELKEFYESEAGRPILETLGDGYLRQQDYSKNMDGVKKYKADLDAWYEGNKAQLEEAAKRKTDPTPPKATEGLLTRDDFKKALDDELATRESAYANFSFTTSRMALRHFRDFGEELDLEALAKDPDVKSVGLVGVYDKLYGPKLKEKAAKAEEKRINDIVATRVAEERKKDLSRPPYPTGSPNDVSPLDALEHPPEKPQTATVEDMAVEYDRLTQERLSRSGVVPA